MKDRDGREERDFLLLSQQKRQRIMKNNNYSQIRPLPTYPSDTNEALSCRVKVNPMKGRFFPLNPSFSRMKSSILGPVAGSDSNSSKLEVSSMLLIVGT